MSSSSSSHYLTGGSSSGGSGPSSRSGRHSNNSHYHHQQQQQQHQSQQQQQQQQRTRKVDKYERFEQWLRDNGAKFEQLELREYDCGNNNKSQVSSSDDMTSSTAAAEEKKETTGILDEEEEDCMDRYNINTGSTTSDNEHQDTAVNEDEEEDESEMRGVHARSHIPPHTICMTVPRRCLITVEMGQATPIGQAILNSDLDLDAPKHIFLMIYVLWDRKVNGRDSFFDPYYQILPQTLSNMPIFWTPAELRALKGSYLLHQIADRNLAIAEDYHAICSIAPCLEQICTLQEFKWARMCVCSRNFGLQMDGHRTSALVPHADMLNHYRPRETKWTFDEDLQAFTITSLQHICPGSQVYDSYGQKCNHRFLLNYGFAVEDNRELDGFCPNEVPLELFVNPDDALFYEKLDFWTRGETTSSSSNSSSSSSVAAMAAMHATNTMTASFLASHISNNNNNASQHPYQQSHSQQQQQAHPYENAMAQPPVVKRIRVCVSNNENTRLLFSLLRALACNAQELRAIRGSSGNGILSMSPGKSTSFFFQPMSSSSNTSAMGALHAEAAHLRSYHLSPPNASSPSSSPLTSSSTSPLPAPSLTVYHRSCRDIRHPISLRNERAAMRLLLEIIGRHLSAYPTTLAQDVADLQNNNESTAFPRFSNARHAKIQVRGEKQVLHHFALWARTALDVLDVIEEELKQEREQQLHGLHDDGRGSDGGGVEVKLTRNGGTVTQCAEEVDEKEHRPSFEYIIRRMEDECDRNMMMHNQQQQGPGGVDTAGPVIHHTILRYCADVLGSLRREEIKSIKRQRAAAMQHHQQQQQQQSQQQQQRSYGSAPHSTGSNGSAGRNSSHGGGSSSYHPYPSTTSPPQQQQHYRQYHHYNNSASSSSNGAQQQQRYSSRNSQGGYGDRGGSGSRSFGHGGGSSSSDYM